MRVRGLPLARRVASAVVCLFISSAVFCETAEAQTLPASCAFTNDPLVAQSTQIRAVHITELRACLNALLAERGASQVGWVDPVITPQQTAMTVTHLEAIAAGSAERVCGG